MRARGANLLIIGLLVCSVLVLSLPTVSSPADNRLAALIESSDLVAVADVVEILEASSPESDPSAMPAAGTPRIARLAPLHVLKGRGAETIDVPFEECLNWPTGPAYAQGERVVVFLGATSQGWATIDLARFPSERALEPLDALDLELLGRGPGATCLPGLSIQRTGTIVP